MLRWLNTIGDAAQALSCFALVASLLFLAHKYRVKPLSRVFVVFGLMFGAFGLRASFAAVLWWHDGLWMEVLATVFRTASAALIVPCAYLTSRCAGRAFFWLRELAVAERRLGKMVGEGRTRVEAQEIAGLVGKLREMTREALALAPER